MVQSMYAKVPGHPYMIKDGSGQNYIISEKVPGHPKHTYKWFKIVVV
jgi:hypothetical protein